MGSSQRLEPIARGSVGKSAYGAIHGAILSGRFSPGERLVESTLAKELGVSRGPVREALRRLCIEGLLIDEMHKGVYLREFTFEDVIQIYTVRIALESVAVRLITRLRIPTERLSERIEEMRYAARQGDVAALTRSELQFHRTLCEMCGNHYISTLFDTLADHIQIALTIDNASYPDLDEIAEMHVPLVEALEAGDELIAQRTLSEHIASSLEFVLKSSKADSSTITRSLVAIAPIPSEALA